jgi:hypothetical protein
VTPESQKKSAGPMVWDVKKDAAIWTSNLLLLPQNLTTASALLAFFSHPDGLIFAQQFPTICSAASVAHEVVWEHAVRRMIFYSIMG